MSLSAANNPQDMTEMLTYFTGIPPRVKKIQEIKGFIFYKRVWVVMWFQKWSGILMGDKYWVGLIRVKLKRFFRFFNMR